MSRRFRGNKEPEDSIRKEAKEEEEVHVQLSKQEEIQPIAILDDLSD